MDTRTSGQAGEAARRWAPLFRSLRTFCLACGGPMSYDSCGDGGPMPEPTRYPEDRGVLGCHVRIKPGLLQPRSKIPDGIVLMDGHTAADVMDRDGTLATVKSKRLDVLERPLHGERVGEAGQLLAARRFAGISPRVRQELLNRAVSQAQKPAERRRLVRDGIALEMPEVIDAVTMTDSELLWWRALAAWKSGDVNATATALEALPRRRYQGQIAVWWHLVSQAGASEEILQRAIRAIGPVSPGDDRRPSGPWVLAIELIRQRFAPTAADSPGGLPAGMGRAAREPLLRLADTFRRQVRESDGPSRDEQDAWLALDQHRLGATDNRPESKLLGAWHHLELWKGDEPTAVSSERRAKAVARLGEDPSVLDEAPGPVLDDLIDAQAIPTAWIDRAHELECGTYLKARTKIDSVDTDALRGIRAHREVARRLAVAGEPIPADLPLDRDTRRPLAIAAALANGDDGARLADHLEIPDKLRPLLQATWDDATSLPPTDLLSDPLLATVLARRSELSHNALQAGGLTGAQRLFASQVLLRQAKEALYAWSWSDALGHARECLRVAREEPQRDEALNLMAAAHWELGNDQDAIKALISALEGEYTSSLQANIAVVAAELEPQVAAVHLARLVNEAPDLALRISAARQAQLIWSLNRELWVEGDRLPSELAAALRALVADPIDEDAFREIVQLLAQHDRDWLAQPGAIDGSPHADSPTARVWVGFARGLDQMIRELATALNAAPEPWMEQLRDDLIASALENLASGRPHEGAVGMGMALLDHGMPARTVQLILLRALTVLGAAQTIAGRARSEPVPELLDWLEQARLDLAKLEAADQPATENAVGIAYDALAATYVTSRLGQLDEIRQLIAQAQAQLKLIPAHMRVDYAALRRALQPAIEFCDDTIRLMNRLIPYVSRELSLTLEEAVRLPADNYRRQMQQIYSRK